MGKQQIAPGALELVRQFVNTIDVESGEERLGDPRDLAGWLLHAGLAPGPDLRARPADLARAIELREALRALLLSHTDGDAEPAEPLEVLDRVAVRARLQLRFTDGAVRLEPQAAGVDGALGRLLSIVQGSIADGTWSRLKACRDPACEWAFYDHTKNRSGCWCTMAECGNRAKARAYRERQGVSGTVD